MAKEKVVKAVAAKAARKFVMAGRGRVIQVPNIRNEILRLAGKAKPKVVYLGTATYESQQGFHMQAKDFASVGCDVRHVKLTDAEDIPPKAELKEIFDTADIIAVSGGNTLFAVRRWKALGVHKLLRAAMDRGAVMCGGSAGAICWFDGGHSDSRDPTTLRHPKENLTEEEKRNWKYIRVSGLGFLSGLCCPHHDSTQSNGVLRATDFDGMLLRHAKETGVCIDDQAAIVLEGDHWKVVSTDGKAKVTIKEVDKDGNIQSKIYTEHDGALDIAKMQTL